MITNSNPLLRNDYYPDQNDIDELNTRINEVQSDVDLLAISVNEKAEAVNGRLNTLQNDYNESFETEALKANTADLNVLNINVQATIKDLNAVNTYTENLIVNKPVFDMVLNTPHIENITSIGGNVYDVNLFNVAVDNLVLNTQLEPVISSAVLGYDYKGRVIPVKASFEVGFPENANYLFTDQYGTAFPGTAETEVKASDNLITANAVYNEALNVAGNIGNLRNDMNNELNIVNDNFANSFNNVNANFDNVSNSFNIVNENFDNVSNSFNNVNANFDNVNSHLNDVDSNIKTINDFIFNFIYIPEYGSFNSMSPVKYNDATTVELYGNAYGGNAIPGGGGLIKFDSSTSKVTFGFSGACRGIENASRMFNDCRFLNQNILIPNSVTNASSMFYGCLSLNQNILIPNSVIDASDMFDLCPNLNQNILIPNSAIYASSMFEDCPNLNRDIYIYSQNITNMYHMFLGTKVNRHNVHIPSSVPKATSNTFYNCLVNGITGVTFAPGNIYNDLPVDPVVWPPVN